MQLGKAHTICILYDKRIGVWDIHAGFDDRGTHQHVNFVFQKLPPYLGQLVFRHFSMAKSHAGLRNLRLDSRSGAFDGSYVVMEIIDLPPTPQFAADGLIDDRIVVFQNICLHGMAVMRRFFNDAHVADTRQCHIEGTGEWGLRKGSTRLHCCREISIFPSVRHRNVALRR